MNHSGISSALSASPSKSMEHARRSGSSDDSSESTFDFLESINYSLFTYIDPLAITLGVLGNVVVCVVSVFTPLKARPWSHVQSATSLVDFIYVISCLVVYLSKLGQPVYDTPSLCQVTTFTLMVSRSLQTWFVFISHFDRLHSHFTHGGESRRRRVYNTKFALIIVALLVVAPSVHVLWSYEVRTMYGRSFCVPMKDDVNFHLIIRKIHIIGSVVVPIALTLGIDLFFILKLSLHFFCSVNDEEDDDDVGHLGVYTGYKIGNDSSFCSENMVQLPLLEKKNEMCEHLLSNTAPIETTRQKQNNNLSTIVENSVTSSGIKNKQDGHPKILINSEKNTNDNTTNNEGTGDKFTILQQKYKCDRKQEVARYILTTTNEVGAEKELSDMTLTFENKAMHEKLSHSPSKLSPDSNRGHYHSKVENNNKRLPRSYRKTGRKKHSGYGGNTKDSSQVSMFSSSINNSCTQNSVSYSHYHSYNYTSMVSNVSKSTAIQEDHIFSSDVTASSVTTVLIGIVMCGLVIPSACTEGKLLFLSDAPTTRPSAVAIQRAILFESLVLFNSVYKIILYVIVLKSFRQAFVWFMVSCVPKRLISSASICTIESDEDNKSDSDNIDDV